MDKYTEEMMKRARESFDNMMEKSTPSQRQAAAFNAMKNAAMIHDPMVKVDRKHLDQLKGPSESDFQSMRISALEEEIARLRAEAEALRVPEWLIEMSRQMRTQDNRCTSNPFWQVRCKRTLPTEQGYNELGYEVCGDDGVVYRSDQPVDVLLEHLIEQHEDWCMAWAEDCHPDEPWQSAMENWWCEDNFEDLPDGLRKVYVQEIEEVVSTHLTEADALAFIGRKQHDYPPLYTYVESAYWAPQLRMLQDWIIGLTAAIDAARGGK